MQNLTEKQRKYMGSMPESTLSVPVVRVQTDISSSLKPSIVPPASQIAGKVVGSGSIPIVEAPAVAVKEEVEPTLSDADIAELGYNKMTVGEVLKLVKDLSPEDRDIILDYEKRHKNRSQVVETLSVGWNG